MQSSTEQRPSEYAVVIEPTATGYGVYVPDPPGCVSVGESREEAIEMITEAIGLRIESLREHGEAVPAPSTQVDRVSVRAARGGAPPEPSQPCRSRRPSASSPSAPSGAVSPVVRCSSPDGGRSRGAVSTPADFEPGH